MMKITLCIPPALLLLMGCAGTTPVTPSLDHPANPNAPAAPLPPPSTVLAHVGPASAPAPAPAGHDMRHAHHGAGSNLPATHPATNPTGAYVCPMHPQVISDRPDKCPRCKMKLVKKEAGK